MVINIFSSFTAMWEYCLKQILFFWEQNSMACVSLSIILGDVSVYIGEMVQWLRALNFLFKRIQFWVPTQTWHFITPSNSCSMDLLTFMGFCICGTHTYYTHTHTYTYIKSLDILELKIWECFTDKFVEKWNEAYCLKIFAKETESELP